MAQCALTLNLLWRSRHEAAVHGSMEHFQNNRSIFNHYDYPLQLHLSTRKKRRKMLTAQSFSIRDLNDRWSSSCSRVRHFVMTRSEYNIGLAIDTLRNYQAVASDHSSGIHENRSSHRDKGTVQLCAIRSRRVCQHVTRSMKQNGTVCLDRSRCGQGERRESCDRKRGIG
jgi:hypothetical protein